MSGTIYGPGEITTLGEAIYREQIQPRVGPVEKGKFVVEDVETGDYEVDSDNAAATRRLLKRKGRTLLRTGCALDTAPAYRHVGGFGTPDRDD